MEPTLEHVHAFGEISTWPGMENLGNPWAQNALSKDEVERMANLSGVNVIDYRGAVYDPVHRQWRARYRWALPAGREGYQGWACMVLAERMKGEWYPFYDAEKEAGVIACDRTGFDWEEATMESLLLQRAVFTLEVRLEAEEIEATLSNLHWWMLDSMGWLGIEIEEVMRVEREERSRQNVFWWARDLSRMWG